MTTKELLERQQWTLDQKIDHSLGVIEQFYNKLDGRVYISFSGGKDSTVLLWLAQKLYPNIKAVFCNTRNEYPDIVKFVRQLKDEGNNIDIIFPKKNPKEVIERFGFPLISKAVAELVYIYKSNPNCKKAQQVIGSQDSGTFNRKIPQAHEWLLHEDFVTSHYCCTKLKKQPFHKYEKEHGVAPILGTMASESNLRRNEYVKRGQCNVFSSKDILKSSSLPLSIWTDEDIYACIRKYNIPICEIYHKGARRTGCMFCGFGCQFPTDVRLRLLYKLYPKWYDHFMKYTNNGVTYREALRKVLNRAGSRLPDEYDRDDLYPLTILI